MSGGLRWIGGQIMPDHHLRDRFGLRVANVHRADDFAAPQHGSALADRHDLAQLVRDQDRGAPLFDQPPQHAEQVFDFLRRQDRRRLIEDQQPGVAVEQLEDLDALLHAHRQIAHGGGRIDLEPKTLG